jgi:uncharacterized membrane protein YphA (DoxX/SURF4 family)
MSQHNKWISFSLRLIAAVIMLQTLFYKFTGAEESVYIFSKIGIEPWGRIGTGMLELAASVMLLIPSFIWAGALLGTGLMSGAVIAHLAILGIEVKDDGGYLFLLALIVLTCCSLTAFLYKHQIPVLKKT